MTAQAFKDPTPYRTYHDIWDDRRLAALIDELGETQLRDLVHLFQGDLAFLLRQFGAAIEAGNDLAAGRVLATIRDAAANLGLQGLSAAAQSLRGQPPDPAFPALLAQEAARIRFVPTLKRAS